MRDAEKVIERLKSVTGAKRDVDLVRAMSLSRSTITSWRARGSVPSRVLEKAADDYQVSLDWLSRGTGEMRIEQERPPIYKVSGAQTDALQLLEAEPGAKKAGGDDRGVAFDDAPGGRQFVPDSHKGTNSVRTPTGDARLAAVLAWWRHFWETADEQERVWALVQLKRAIPESEGWIRRWIQDHDAGG